MLLPITSDLKALFLCISHRHSHTHHLIQSSIMRKKSCDLEILSSFLAYVALFPPILMPKY